MLWPTSGYMHTCPIYVYDTLCPPTYRYICVKRECACKHIIHTRVQHCETNQYMYLGCKTISCEYVRNLTDMYVPIHVHVWDYKYWTAQTLQKVAGRLRDVYSYAGVLNFKGNKVK